MAKPIAIPVEVEDLCYLGCGKKARFRFSVSQKLCCSDHFNKCSAKRGRFSQGADHKENARKSLKTRIRLGITKSAQIKGAKTRKASGHYDRLAVKMREHWSEAPWNNLPKWSTYKTTTIRIQSSYERKFLEGLEQDHGLDWVSENVRRGPCFYYIDPSTQKERLYISDFLIDDRVYEIKGDYTWNRKGDDKGLEKLNRSKLDSVIEQGYEVTLVLEGVAIPWTKGLMNFCG